YLRAASTGSVPEDDQQDTERAGDRQRHVAQLAEHFLAKVDRRGDGQQDEANEGSQRESNEQQRVAKRIRPGDEHSKADRGQQMHSGQQRSIAGDSRSPPEDRDDLKPGETGGRPQPHGSPVRPGGSARHRARLPTRPAPPPPESPLPAPESARCCRRWPETRASRACPPETETAVEPRTCCPARFRARASER